MRSVSYVRLTFLRFRLNRLRGDYVEGVAVPSLKITKRTVDALPVPGGADVYHWDNHPQGPQGFGVRVTPNVYTTLNELDKFCEAVEHVAKRGLPKAG